MCSPVELWTRGWHPMVTSNPAAFGGPTRRFTPLGERAMMIYSDRLSSLKPARRGARPVLTDSKAAQRHILCEG